MVPLHPHPSPGLGHQREAGLPGLQTDTVRGLSWVRRMPHLDPGQPQSDEDCSEAGTLPMSWPYPGDPGDHSAPQSPRSWRFLPTPTLFQPARDQRTAHSPSTYPLRALCAPRPLSGFPLGEARVLLRGALWPPSPSLLSLHQDAMVSLRSLPPLLPPPRSPS